MAFKGNRFNIYRYILLGRLNFILLGYSRLLIIIILFEGIALILTIPELGLIADLSRHSIESQGSIYTFEIVGLVASILTLLVLPVLCVILPALLWPLRNDGRQHFLFRIFWPRISPGSLVSFFIFEIPMFCE